VSGFVGTPAIRLSELLAGLSLVTDLGMGNPPEEAMRATLLAIGLAREAGSSEADVVSVYYTTLLRYVGCHGYAHEESEIFGDDIAVRAGGARVDFGNPREVLSFFIHGVGRDEPPLRRARTVASALAGGKRFGTDLARAHCEVGSLVARRLSLPAAVATALGQIFERWDGRGGPARIGGEEIEPATRFALVATQGVLFSQAGGSEAAADVLLRRAGGALDPRIVDIFVRHGPGLLSAIEEADVLRAVVDDEPEPRRFVHGLDQVGATFADLADLKSPFFHGHARGVAALAESAARTLGLPGSDVETLRCAALLADLGRAGVPNSIWNRAGPLSSADLELVRLHAYQTERILSRCPALAEVAPLAGMHHERQDGSGYHRQIQRGAIPPAARCLAAADVFQAMREQRPYRPALDEGRAAEELTSEARSGHLDPDAVVAVLSAAGLPAERTSRTWPAGLSEREVDVLRLAAGGLTTRQIARRLGVTPKTADHHIQHIYSKIGVSTRAAAAMFAMEHDLVRP
jgi:HD-GYP domain-containing protein (c-di-GMP phosphodiesterase class II)